MVDDVRRRRERRALVRRDVVERAEVPRLVGRERDVRDADDRDAAVRLLRLGDGAVERAPAGVGAVEADKDASHRDSLTPPAPAMDEFLRPAFRRGTIGLVRNWAG